jgi:uncharacterized membrane protein YecN with MAPEG domain
MADMKVTILTAAILGAGLVGLSLPVSLRRRATHISTGWGDDETLHRLIRAQGNFTEYAPMGLILLGLMELGGGSALMVWLVALTLMLGRAVHAAGMLLGSIPMRALAMISTHFSLIAAGVGLVLLLSRA